MNSECYYCLRDHTGIVHTEIVAEVVVEIVAEIGSVMARRIRLDG